MRGAPVLLLLVLCFPLVTMNRVYVHPFSLFAYNFSCELIQAQVHKLPEMVKPAPLAHQGVVEPEVQQQQAEGAGQPTNQQMAVLSKLQNALGLYFYHILRQQKATNALFSPGNAFGTLATFYVGAANDTADSLQELLGLAPASKKRECQSLFDGHKVLRTLQSINALVNSSTDEFSTQVWTFTGTGIDLSQEFVKGTKDFRDASYFRSVDFSKTEEAEAQVNSFIQKTSAGKIKHLFNAISPSSNLLFASAVHFKARWRTAVQPEATSLLKFWADDNTSVTVPLTSHVGKFMYLDDKAVKCFVVKLPLKKKAYILLVLPHEGTKLDHVEAQLTPQLLSNWNQHLKERSVHLTLPKFSVNAVSDLKGILSDLKLSYLLDESANFGRLSSKENITVDKVLNKVVFEVSGEGAEGQVQPEGDGVPLKLTVNRPFFLAVMEEDLDAILLLGRMTNPAL